ncbi:MAG: short-chain dehydrogenase [Flavobacteriaceae bacterium]|nr:short-chain dehydrogenase [Flavobacteriaceae bacterium]|tara:strand:- start:117683 stop:118408 length:726 start_codon:yes stop_codon:yes gene_type:complete
MNVLIITGGSKGIGKGIAEYYAANDYLVYSLSRTKSNLKKCEEVEVDILDLPLAEQKLNYILHKIDFNYVDKITLINNAGRLGKIASLGNLNASDIDTSIKLNTTVPLVLSNLFIDATKDLKSEKQIINISSGAAANPYVGWSVYCTSKAAIDMMTRTIALEQEGLANGVNCMSIYPGVVDTNMQTQIRSTSIEDFKNVDRFIGLKQNNELYTPEYVGQRIYEMDHGQQLNNGDILDIRYK